MEPLSAEKTFQDLRKRQTYAVIFSVILLLLIALIMIFKACYSYTHANRRAKEYSMSIHTIVHKEKVDLSTLTQAGLEDRQYIYRTYLSIQKDIFIVLLALMGAVSYYGIHKWQKKYQELCDRMARANKSGDHAEYP